MVRCAKPWSVDPHQSFVLAGAYKPVYKTGRYVVAFIEMGTVPCPTRRDLVLAMVSGTKQHSTHICVLQGYIAQNTHTLPRLDDEGSPFRTRRTPCFSIDTEPISHQASLSMTVQSFCTHARHTNIVSKTEGPRRLDKKPRGSQAQGFGPCPSKYEPFNCWNDRSRHYPILDIEGGEVAP